MIPQRTVYFIIAVQLAMVLPALPSTVNANFTAPSTVPVTAPSYSATGNDVSISLGFTPPTGANLTVVKNTGLGFITGQFSNLTQGQTVNLSYNGITYKFVANYYGGTGNDLVLQWAYQDLSNWGSNGHGALGNNSATSSITPVGVDRSGVLAGKIVIQVSAGYSHSLALCSDGTIASWGYNGSGGLDPGYGQLGNATNTDSNVPVLVSRSGVLAGKTVVAISAGAYHSLALCSDGTVAAWGWNAAGQLGDGTTSSSSVPVLVSSSGALVGKTVVAISAAYSHSLALCSDGTVAAWGGNGGALGNNSTANSSVPVLVYQSGVLAGKIAVAISAGGGHSLALCSDGTIASWGGNSSYQLGNNSTTSSSVPVAVIQNGALEGKTVVAVAAGGSYSLALCSDGTIAGWGDNFSGQLGTSSPSSAFAPVAAVQSGVLAGKSVIAVSAKASHSSVLCSDGTIASWGSNQYGAFPNYSTVPSLVTQSGRLVGETAVAVSAGGYHDLALAAVQNSCDLSSIALSSGTLDPSFDPTITSYSASVASAVLSVTVTPTTLISLATISVNGIAVTSGNASQAISLTAGANMVTVRVTAPDGTTTKTYTINIPLSVVSTLSGLMLNAGTLSPTFDPTLASYGANVANATTSLTVTPTVTDLAATVKVNGTTVASGSASPGIPLAVGPNTISVEVTAQDATTTTTYSVTVYRLPSANAPYTGQFGNFTYTDNGASMTIIAYSSNGVGAVQVPPLIYGRAVTSIAASAFSGHTSPTNVSIPEGITTIGDSAFYGCTGLASVAIPGSVTIVGHAAFACCPSLTNITIPGSDISIGQSAFQGCTSLTSVTIGNDVFSLGSGVINLGYGLFSGCTSLTSLTFRKSVISIDYLSSDSPSLTSVTISNSVTLIGDISLPGCTSLINLTIPNSVTSIGDISLPGCTSLINLTIPNSVTSIGDISLPGCTSLTSLRIPDSVTSIGNFYCDDGCTSLTSVTLPNSVTSIGGISCYGCTSLANMNIPAGITSYGSIIFAGCTSLTSIRIPSGVTALDGELLNGLGTFSDCWELASVSIPNSVTSIGQDAFRYCWNLTSVTIPGSVTQIGDHAFSDCAGLTSATIPKGVRSLGDGSFEYCTSLSSVTIPSGMTSIGNHAFYSCPELANVYFLGNAPAIGANAFWGAKAGLTIYYFNGTTGFTSPTWNGIKTVNMGAPSPAVGWLLGQGLPYNANLQSDTNGDGVTLLMAYALNLDPAQNLRGSMPSPVIAGNQMSLTYYAGSAGVTYAVQTSTDLSNWSTAGVTTSGLDANNCRTATATMNGPCRYMRLVVGY